MIGTHDFKGSHQHHQEDSLVGELTLLHKMGHTDCIISESHLDSVEMEIRREPKGWWQSLRAVFGKKYYRSITVPKPPELALAELCTSICYTKAAVLGLKVPLIDRERATKWFITYFAEEGVTGALEAEDSDGLLEVLKSAVTSFRSRHRCKESLELELLFVDDAPSMDSFMA